MTQPTTPIESAPADASPSETLLAALSECDREINSLRGALSAAEAERASLIAQLLRSVERTERSMSATALRVEQLTALAGKREPDLAALAAPVQRQRPAASAPFPTERPADERPVRRPDVPSAEPVILRPSTSAHDGQPAGLKPTVALAAPTSGAIARLLESVSGMAQFVSLEGHISASDLRSRLPSGWEVTELADPDGAHLVYRCVSKRPEDVWFEHGAAYLDVLSTHAFSGRLDGALLSRALRFLKALPEIPGEHLEHLEAHGTVRTRLSCTNEEMQERLAVLASRKAVVDGWLSRTRAAGRDQRVIDRARAPATPHPFTDLDPLSLHDASSEPAHSPTALAFAAAVLEKMQATERAQAHLSALEAQPAPVRTSESLSAPSGHQRVAGPLRELLEFLVSSDEHPVSDLRDRASALGLLPLDAVRALNTQAADMSTGEQLLEVVGDELLVDTDAAKELLAR